MPTRAASKTELAQATPSPWIERNHLVIELGLEWLRAELGCYVEAMRAARPSNGAGSDHLTDLEADWLLRGGGRGTGAEGARARFMTARHEMRTAGQPASIDRLALLFALSPFDEDCLLLALAPRLDASFCALFGYAQDRLQLSTATLHLARVLFAGAPGEAQWRVLDRFSPDAPLRRFGLIWIDDAHQAALSPFEIDERVMRFLIGEDYLDPRLRGVLSPVGAAPVPDRHRLAAQALAANLRRSGRCSAIVFGPPQSGKRAVATRIAEEIGLGIKELSPDFASGGPETQRSHLALLAREATLGGFAVLVDASHVSRAESDARARAARELAQTMLLDFDGACLVVAEDRLDVAPSVPRLKLAALDSADRLSIWRNELGPSHRAEDVERVAEHFRFGPSDIPVIARHADETDGLWAASRAYASRGLDDLAERIEPRFTWDDIVLPANVLHDLHAITAQVRYQSQVYNRGGFGKKLVRGRGISALFAGPSGVGKTMAAEVIARELGLDLCRIDLSGVVSKYIGETERHLNTIMRKMEVGGAVLFFDECDALFGMRSEVKDSHDRYANIEVSYLLQRMESYSGLAILATNLKGHVDPAFMRRLRFVIDIPFPDANLRRSIWQRVFPAETPTDRLDFDALARLEVPGGNISVIAVNAAFLAAAEGGPVKMSHIGRAAQGEFRKIDKEFKATWRERE